MSYLGNNSLSKLWQKVKSIVPTKVSQLQNDSNFIVSETDPTVPDWAKQSTKPNYTPIEVGAMPASTTVTAFWSGTQAQYDSITTKSATTQYMIIEE